MSVLQKGLIAVNGSIMLSRETKEESPPQTSESVAHVASRSWRCVGAKGFQSLLGEGRSDVGCGIESNARRREGHFSPTALPARPPSLRQRPRPLFPYPKSARKTPRELRLWEAGDGPFSYFDFVSYGMLLTPITFRITISQMKKPSTQKRAAILRCLIEGNSVL